jgi:RimJ/RimL family protein N-acetyltransferase
VRVREAVPDDAAALLRLFQEIHAETSFMLFEPGEWHPTVEEQAKRIELGEKTRAAVFLLAEGDDGALAGGAFGTRGIARRSYHALHIVIGVLQAWAGRGVGRALVNALEDWARANGVQRIELTVQNGNTRAIALYEKCGFEQEGVKRRSLKVGGRFVDELFMAKLLP